MNRRESGGLSLRFCWPKAFFTVAWGSTPGRRAGSRIVLADGHSHLRTDRQNHRRVKATDVIRWATHGTDGGIRRCMQGEYGRWPTIMRESARRPGVLPQATVLMAFGQEVSGRFKTEVLPQATLSMAFGQKALEGFRSPGVLPQATVLMAFGQEASGRFKTGVLPQTTLSMAFGQAWRNISG
jgi:hypothetical protein